MGRIRKIQDTLLNMAKVFSSKTNSSQSTYSCDYINKLTAYDTEEHVVGTYEGKPLYRKIISGTFGTVTQDTESEVTIEVVDSDFVLVKDYWLDRMESNNSYNQGYGYDTLYLGYSNVQNNKTTLRFRTKQNWASNTSFYAIIEYTKTTDTETSSIATEITDGGRVINTQSDSVYDTYSCDYVNELTKSNNYRKIFTSKLYVNNSAVTATIQLPGTPYYTYHLVIYSRFETEKNILIAVKANGNGVTLSGDTTISNITFSTDGLNVIMTSSNWNNILFEILSSTGVSDVNVSYKTV